MSRTLTADEVASALATLPGWSGDTSALRLSSQFPDFPTAIEAVRRVADDAERLGHHPDMDIRWRTVTFVLTTHSAGAVTDLDVELARRIADITASLLP